MNEADAIARLKRGDIGGLEALVKQYYLPAVRTAYLISRDRVMADDIVQTAFLRLYERIHQFDSARLFAPWFLRCVVNDARMAGRAQERLVPLNLNNEPGNSGTEIHLLPDLGMDLDQMLIAAETREAIWEALGKISTEQRAVIVLRYYLDLSEAEMSYELDCPPGTVKSRLHTARLRLRRLLPTWLAPSAKD